MSDHPTDQDNDRTQASAESGHDKRHVFDDLSSHESSPAPRDMEMINDIPVRLSVEMGSKKLTIRDLLDLARGSIVELDNPANEPMNILCNGYLIAQGEVVVVDEKYGVRITEIASRSERINRLR